VGIDASVPRFSHDHRLPPGSTLLLFTDGLVERRDQDIDTGLDELAEQAAGLATAPLEELCGVLIGRDRQVFDDDVAMVALRVPADAAEGDAAEGDVAEGERQPSGVCPCGQSARPPDAGASRVASAIEPKNR
jgi:hypothetical protein